jgi:hypothetical protein
MLVSLLEPKDVAGEIEPAQRPASVGQHFHGPHRTVRDLVDVFDRLALAVDLAAGAELHRHAEHRSRQHAGLCRRIDACAAPLASLVALFADIARVHALLPNEPDLTRRRAVQACRHLVTH